MRTLVVAALLATAVLAHNECNPRSCSGIDLRGLCANTYGGFVNLCPRGERSVDVDARMPVDTGCMSIQPYAIESRDTNGTTNAIRMLSFTSTGSNGGAVPTNCTAYPHCVKRSDDNNMTFTSYTATYGSFMMATDYVDRNGDLRRFDGSASVGYSVARQAAKLYYGNDQAHSVSLNNGDVFVNFDLTATNTWIAPTDDLWFLFRISNHGSNPFQMSLSSGARPTANGVTFFEKAVNSTGMYSTMHPTVWVTPEMKVVKRFEVNPVTWKQEVSEFLAIKLANAHSTMRLIATIARP